MDSKDRVFVTSRSTSPCVAIFDRAGKLLVYRFDPSAHTIAANDPPAMNLQPGAGPRHFAFHPDGKRAYVIDELDSTLTSCDYEAGRGVLTPRQTVSTLPQDFKGNNSTAEVVVHPSGKFVYGSNRGHDTIAAFKVDLHDGKLTFIARQGEGIKVPRNFAVEPSGKYLLVGNQEGNTISVFRVDPKTGGLTLAGKPVEAASPVCLRMIPAK